METLSKYRTYNSDSINFNIDFGGILKNLRNIETADLLHIYSGKLIP